MRKHVRYKRIASLALSMSLILGLVLTNTYAALSLGENQLYSYIGTYMSERENQNVNISDVKELENLDEVNAYICAKFNEGGYAIIHAETMKMSEYTLSGDVPFDWNEPRIIYAGPGNYFVPSEWQNVAKSQSENYQKIRAAEDVFLEDAYQSMQSIASDPNYTTVTHTVKINGVTMNASTMMPYNFGSDANCLTKVYGEDVYKQYSKGICGTTSCAALLAFYQDKVNPNINYIPTSMRPSNRNADTFKAHLFQYIDYGHPGGSTNYVLANGLNSYFRSQGISGQCSASTTIQMTSYNAISKIYGNRPIIIGVLSMLGATTGDHFMLAYKFTADLNMTVAEYRNVMFTACRLQDGHLNAAFTFSESWVGGIVYLNH